MMQQDFIQISISIKDDLHEFLIAELFDLDFEGFEQADNHITATIPASRFDDFKREEIERMVFEMGGEIENESIVEPQNWNETWEQSIQPQSIGRFYVHPTWAINEKQPEGKTELIIDPKMAFGTGYHATTRLMLENMPEVINPGDDVLDAGTGTGILGIAAIKLGAQSAFGFDIDEWSETNARENMMFNNVQNFEVRLGSAEVIPAGREFDVILANINRNALIELIPVLTKHLKENGKLLISGLLEEDESTFLNMPALQSFTHRKTAQQQEWIAIIFE